MNGSVIALLFLLVLCFALPALFTWAEGMEYSTKDLDNAGYSTRMDPDYDIPTKDEDLDATFFDTIHTGAYYKEEEDDRKYLSGSHKIKDAEPTKGRSAQDVMNKKVSQNVDTLGDIDAINERYTTKDPPTGSLENNMSWLETMMRRAKEGFTVQTKITRAAASAKVKAAIDAESNAVLESIAAKKTYDDAITEKELAATAKNKAEIATPLDAAAVATATTSLTAAQAKVDSTKIALDKADAKVVLTATELAKARNDSIQAEDRAVEDAIAEEKAAIVASTNATKALNNLPTTATDAERSAAIAAQTNANNQVVLKAKATHAAKTAAATAKVQAGMSPITRQVTDLSDNLMWDISNNQSLYNVNGTLDTGPYVSFADLKKVEEDYKALNEKCKTQTKLDCIADFGTNIGEDLCCGQTGVLQDTRYVCPSIKPKCQSFKCGSKFGQCV